MGLNWSEGLKQLGGGLDIQAQQKSHNTDLLYKEVSDENQRRWKSNEANVNREFLASQQEKKLKSDDARAIKQLEATTELRLATLASTEAYQTGRLGQGQQKIDVDKAGNAESVYSNEIKEINTAYKNATAGVMVSDTEKSAAKTMRDNAKGAAKLRRDAPEAYPIYESTMGIIGGSKDGHKLSLYYARQNEESQAEIAAAAQRNLKELEKSGKTGEAANFAAVMKAIDEHKGGNNKLLDLSLVDDVEGPQAEFISPMASNTEEGAAAIVAGTGTTQTTQSGKVTETKLEEVGAAVELDYRPLSALKRMVKMKGGMSDAGRGVVFSLIPNSGVLNATLEKYGITGDDAAKVSTMYAEWKTKDRTPRQASTRRRRASVRR